MAGKAYIKPKGIQTPLAPTEVEQVDNGGEEEKSNSVLEAQSKRVRHPGPWIKATQEEIEKYTAEGRIVGHDPKTGEVILKEE